tara:strand:- start:116 stop:1021 length:906 start_codon:yes stop_codon:yes gene_type:complete
MSATRDRKRGLGRGLDSLLGDAVRGRPSEDSEDASPGAIRTLPTASLKPHPDQPRRHFAQAALDELAASIRQRGIIQPIVVRPAPRGSGYQIIAGERRWRAAQRAALHEVPVIVRDFEDSEALEIALIENVQREDLNPVEEAEAYHRLTEEFGHSQKAVAALVDKSRSHVANLMRLLDLPQSVREMILEERLQMGHARALIGQDEAEALALRTEKEGLTVRDVERLVRNSRDGGSAQPRKKSGNTKRSNDPDIMALETQLSDLLGLDIAIHSEGETGRMTIPYASLDQLDMLCQRLSGGDL